MNTTKHTCPVCSTPLSIQAVTASVIVWCAYGPCPSHVCGEGVESEIIDGAVNKLYRMFEQEVGMNDEVNYGN